MHGVDHPSDLAFVGAGPGGDAEAAQEGDEQIEPLVGHTIAGGSLGLRLTDESSQSLPERLAMLDTEGLEAAGGPAEFGRGVNEEAALLIGARDDLAPQELQKGMDSVDPWPGELDESRHHVHPTGEVAAKDSGEQLLLGSERAVEARFMDVAGVDEIGHRSLGVAFPPEKRR